VLDAEPLFLNDGREGERERGSRRRKRNIIFSFYLSRGSGPAAALSDGNDLRATAKKTSVLVPQSRHKRPAIMARLRKTPKPTKEFARYIDFFKK
jgi:hypothetical protein